MKNKTKLGILYKLEYHVIANYYISQIIFLPISVWLG